MKSDRSQTFLLTGAAGFIGSHVAEALLARGHLVLAVDNFNPQYDPRRKRSNLEQVMESARVSPGDLVFAEADIRDREALESLAAGHELDAVIHLAAMPGVRASLDQPSLCFDVNVNGTIALLGFAAERGVPHFVMASSSSVYGDCAGELFKETDACDRPLSPYAASKRACELLGYTWHGVYGLSFTALRYFSVYGPRGRPDMMPYKILDNMFMGREVVLYEGGRVKRDWTYVADVVAATVSAAERPGGYEIMNVGCGEPILMSDFVALAERISGGKTNLGSSAKPAVDMRFTHADISRAREHLAYEPKVSVEEGVRRFWDWYRRWVIEERLAS